MAGPTSLGGDHVALRVLATLLRSRPQTLQELRELRSLPTDDLDGVLERLVRSGFIELADDRISYHAPDRAIEAQVSALADLVTVLPELTREWRRGADTAAAIDAELVHGHEEQWRAWARYAALTPPVAPLTAVTRAVGYFCCSAPAQRRQNIHSGLEASPPAVMLSPNATIFTALPVLSFF